MNARIGVAESSKVIEIEISDPGAFQQEVEEAMASDEGMAWFTDVKKRTVGVPTSRIAYVEIDSDDSAHRVGFTPGT